MNTTPESKTNWFKITFTKDQVSKGEHYKINDAFRKVSQEIYFNQDFKEIVLLVDDYTGDYIVYISEKTLDLEIFKIFLDENYTLVNASLTDAKSLSFLAGDKFFASKFTFSSR